MPAEPVPLLRQGSDEPDSVLRALLGCFVSGIACIVLLAAVVAALHGRAVGTGALEDYRSWLPLVPVSIAGALVAVLISPKQPFAAGLPPLLVLSLLILGLGRGLGALNSAQTAQAALMLFIMLILPGLAVIILTTVMGRLRRAERVTRGDEIP